MEEHFSWCCMRHYPITSLETRSKKEKNYGQKRRAYWRAKLDRHWIRYQGISNCVRQQTRKDHMSYVNLMTWNAKSFWWWIKNIKASKSIIPEIVHLGKVAKSDVEKAGIFNNFFCSIFTREDASALADLKAQLRYSVNSITSVSNVAQIPFQVVFTRRMTPSLMNR